MADRVPQAPSTPRPKGAIAEGQFLLLPSDESSTSSDDMLTHPPSIILSSTRNINELLGTLCSPPYQLGDDNSNHSSLSPTKGKHQASPKSSLLHGFEGFVTWNDGNKCEEQPPLPPPSPAHSGADKSFQTESTSSNSNHYSKSGDLFSLPTCKNKVWVDLNDGSVIDSSSTPQNRKWHLFLSAACVVVLLLGVGATIAVVVSKRDPEEGRSQRAIDLAGDETAGDTFAPVLSPITPSFEPTLLSSDGPSCMPSSYPSTSMPTIVPELHLCDLGCFTNNDCHDALVCENITEDTRYVEEDCPGLPANELVGTTRCLHPPINMVVRGSETIEEPLGRCEGDCDEDSHCGLGLICFQRRSANELVPTCRGGTQHTALNDVCILDTEYSQRVYGEIPEPPLNRLTLCSRGCEVDDDCDLFLVCSDESSLAKGSGCGDNVFSGNRCTYPRLIHYEEPLRRTRFPIRACGSTCDRLTDCGPGLTCHPHRNGNRVPGCVGKPREGENYCIFDKEQDDLPPAEAPYSLPMLGNDDDETITYRPGLLTVRKDQLILSQGLDARVVALSEHPVLSHDGGWSRRRFHRRPDGAATFADPSGSGGFAYVSNSEEPDRGKGGVGAIYFDKDGEVIDYKMILTNTTMNCGGGRTPWNTWVTNEEYEDGEIWQVDPYGRREPEKTQVGRDRGAWESFAHDVDRLQFFATEDQPDGALVRFRPDAALVDLEKKAWNALHVDGIVDYLLLQRSSSSGDRGTYRWTADRSQAQSSAEELYPSTEGIDCKNSTLYFVSKTEQMMYIVDLAGDTWRRETTKLGLFDGDPDQMQRIMGDESNTLFFTEEQGKESGVHARDIQGRYYVIVMSEELRGETTGLAFSPDGRFLFVAYQEMGKLFVIWRRDQNPFHGKTLDVKYHYDQVLA